MFVRTVPLSFMGYQMKNLININIKSKRCIKCKEVKHLTNFNFRGKSKSTGKRYFSSYCKRCDVAKNREYRLKIKK